MIVKEMDVVVMVAMKVLGMMVRVTIGGVPVVVGLCVFILQARRRCFVFVAWEDLIIS